MTNTKTAPSVTVVTVVYNAVHDIEETMRSVLSQDSRDLEYIVIDGGSTDGTVDVIDRYRDRLSYAISEKDRNLYDGMNKGIAAATGDFLIFMNAGDSFYSPSTVSSVLETAEPDSDLIYGSCVKIVSGFLHVVGTRKLTDLWKGMIFCHQSLFTRTSLLKNRPFDINLNISADFDFVYSMYVQGKKFQELPFPICRYLEGGLSSQNALKGIEQNLSIVSRHNPGHNTTIYYKFLRHWVRAKLLVRQLLPTCLLVRYHAFKSVVSRVRSSLP